MKTRHHLAAAFCIAATLTAGIGLASCTEDARTPGADADPTTTPLIFTASMAASADAPATRANTARGVWTEGDWVAVEANGVVKKYLVHLDNGVATLRPADIDNTHFWPDLEQSVRVRAWRYGNDQDHRWDKETHWWFVETNQDGTASNGESLYQRSDFLYAPEKSVSYSPETGAGLTFYHQTARIVVRIREAGVVTADNKEMVSVLIGSNKDGIQLQIDGRFEAMQIDPANGQYSGLIDPMGTKGNIIPKPIPEPGTGYAHSYEALIIPQDMSNKTLIEVEIDKTYYQYIPTSANLQGGYTYTYDITVSENGKLEVTASEPILGWEDSEKGGSGMAHEVVLPLDGSTVIKDNRTYLLTGTNQNASGNLVWIVGGNPTIILRDVDIKGMASIWIGDSGTTILKVEGNNRIIGDGIEVITVRKNATVRIIGDGRDKSRLTVKADSYAIGDLFECGNIDISGITLVAEGSRNPAIGVGEEVMYGKRKCGSITITDSHVEATGGPGAAAIGFGYSSRADENSIHEMGDITITNSTIKCTVEQGFNGVWPAHIGGSSNGKGRYTVGKITITPPEGMRGTEFFKDFKGSEDPGGIIVGFPNEAKPSNLGEFDIWWRDGSCGSFINGLIVPRLP